MTSIVSNKIQVIVRVRPSLMSEKNHTFDLLNVDKERNIIQVKGMGDSGEKSFHFDKVADGTVSQEDFYSCAGLSNIIKSVLQGYHATIFAYGQTGSGKTFTMEGYEYETTLKRMGSNVQQSVKPNFLTVNRKDRLGVGPRVVHEIFESIASLQENDISSSNISYSVKCSFLQIYNENIYDLLNSVEKTSLSGDKQGLRLRWNANQEFYVENLFITSCQSPEELLGYYQAGIQQKIMASHQMNAASSRSHSVFTIYIEYSLNANEITKSKLSLVDLAGSERVSKTGAQGTVLQESIGINKSLFVLRQVVGLLADSQGHAKLAHIPYRDSKLTSILKHSLGGNSITLMVGCLSPSDTNFEENLSTLTYAARAQSISNKPIKNEDPKTRLIRMQKEEIESLKKQLNHAQQVILGLEMSSNIHSMPHINSTCQIFQQNDEDHQKTSTSMTYNPLPTTQILKDDQKTQLKLNLLENIHMIKTMYKNEQHLRNQLDDETKTREKWEREGIYLSSENNRLREKIEVLEYLVATSTPNGKREECPPRQEMIQEALAIAQIHKKQSNEVNLIKPFNEGNLHNPLTTRDDDDDDDGGGVFPSDEKLARNTCHFVEGNQLETVSQRKNFDLITTSTTISPSSTTISPSSTTISPSTTTTTTFLQSFSFLSSLSATSSSNEATTIRQQKKSGTCNKSGTLSINDLQKLLHPTDPKGTKPNHIMDNQMWFKHSFQRKQNPSSSLLSNVSKQTTIDSHQNMDELNKLIKNKTHRKRNATVYHPPQ